MPPATMTSALPAARLSAAIIAAFMPEPHILLIVTASVDLGRPAPSAAWRAGAWPRPAGGCQPMSPRSLSTGGTHARSPEAPTAGAPQSVALAPASAPWQTPLGGRA